MLWRSAFPSPALLATGYQLVTARPAELQHLRRRDRRRRRSPRVPFLVFAAPFIIMRDTAPRPPARGPQNFSSPLVATVIAGCWSLMSGQVVMVRACGLRSPNAAFQSPQSATSRTFRERDMPIYELDGQAPGISGRRPILGRRDRGADRHACG